MGTRRVITAFAVLLPAVPIIAGLVIASGGSSTQAATQPAYVPLRSRPPSGPQATHLPAGSGALVAVVLHTTTLRKAPAGPRLGKLPTHTQFGSPEALWVVKHVPGWLGVISTLAGNGKVGWLPQRDASLSRVDWELRVSLSSRRLTVLERGKVQRQYTVAVGRPDAPTPTGRFAVTDRLNTNDPTGPYGCCILALSARSPHAIQGWSGGNRIAIHSTPDTPSIGQPVSHGCLRLTLAEGRWLLSHIPLGTPTLISS